MTFRVESPCTIILLFGILSRSGSRACKPCLPQGVSYMEFPLKKSIGVYSVVVSVS